MSWSPSPPSRATRIRLDQASFQQMVTGESVNANIKNRECLPMTWDRHLVLFGRRACSPHVSLPALRHGTSPPPRPPMLALGNEFPNIWRDNSNSIGRRFILFDFNEEVADEDKDGLLKRRIRRREVPMFIRKCLVAYRTTVARWGSKIIWGKDDATSRRILPDYFRETQRALRQDSNLLTGFLVPGVCASAKYGSRYIFHPSAYVKFETFQKGTVLRGGVCIHGVAIPAAPLDTHARFACTHRFQSVLSRQGTSPGDGAQEGSIQHRIPSTRSDRRGQRDASVVGCTGLRRRDGRFQGLAIEIHRRDWHALSFPGRV